MIHKILADNDTTEVTTTLAIFVGWKDALPSQCSKLEIEAFLKYGVRKLLIPVLLSYFQDQKIVVK